MSKVILTKKVDGHEVIVGFRKLSIEPIETKKIVDVEIEKTAEFIDNGVKYNQKITAIKLSSEKKKAAGEKQKKNDKAGADALWADAVIIDKQVETYEEELKVLSRDLAAKKKELMQTHAVYFEPSRGEIAKSDDEIAVLMDKVATAQGFVCPDGTVLADNRGARFAVDKNGKWNYHEIVSIGVDIPADAIMYDDLDADQKKAVDLQREIDAASKLSAADRVQCKSLESEKALNEAAGLRSKLEIQGADDALEQSQEFYNSRLSELEVIYG
jgi:hypothetical protein